MLYCHGERGAAARAGESETGAGVFAALERFGEGAGLARSLEIAADLNNIARSSTLSGPIHLARARPGLRRLGVHHRCAAGCRDAAHGALPPACMAARADGGPWGQAALPAQTRACCRQRLCQA
jgi:hypothetical protein